MNPRPMTIQRRLGLVGLTALITLAPTLVAQADTVPGATPDTTPADTDIALNVAAELARLGGAGAKLDTSPTDDECVYGADPEPVTYSTREIVLRAGLTEDAAKTAVNDAITATDSPGKATDVETINLPTVPAPDARVAGTLVPVQVVHLVPDAFGEVDVVEVARNLRENHVLASPNYLMAPQKDGPVGVLPNGYPVSTTLVTEPRPDATLGEGTNVMVMDVGVPPAEQANIAPKLKQFERGADIEVLDVDAPLGKVDRYWAGHTAVIGDIFATLAPGARVQAVKVTGPDRIITDVSATRRMADALVKATNAPEVIVASFGSAACNVNSNPNGPEMVPLGLQAIAQVVDRRRESVIVAAAGNNSTNRRFYPAAFDTTPQPGQANSAVIAVGALDVISATDPEELEDTGMWISETRSGPPAEFSNYGPWVDAWAPGEGLLVRHIKGLDFLLEDKVPPLNGQAEASGTSYAAPALGALIVEQLSRVGGPPLSAWISIRSAGAPCTGGLGGKAVALTSMDARADEFATGVSECVPTP